MIIKKGFTRIAFIGKKHTVKIPRFSIKEAAVEIKENAKLIWQNRGSLARVKEVISVCTSCTFNSGALAGFKANYVEWKNSKGLGEDVVPTRFSLFGLVNVMDSAKPIRCAKYVFALVFPTTDPHSHTFGNRDNFGLHNGKMKLLDYGSAGAVKFMINNSKEYYRRIAIIIRYMNIK